MGSDCSLGMFRCLVSLIFGPGVQRATDIIWNQKRPHEGVKTLERAMPGDLRVTTDNPLPQMAKTYGCDVSRLPVPPPNTLALVEPKE